MRILVFGAGVLGSLYAARLHDAGHDVTILARGERLEAIRRSGIVVLDESDGLLATSLVPAVDRLGPADRYDVAMVFVHREQRLEAAAALPADAAPTVLFMGNDPTAGEALREALGSRLVLGFPMAGGAIVDGVVHARVAGDRAPTVIGEIEGSESARVRELALVLRSAGFPTSVSTAIGPWLTTHAVLVAPVACAIYGAGGDMARLVRTPDLLLLTIRAVREGFEVLRALGIPVTPAAYRALAAVPEGILAGALSRGFATDRAELMLSRHALTAREEMAALTADVAALAERAGVPTPAFDRLAGWIDPAMEPMEEGSRTLVVAHPRRAAGIAGASALVGLAVGLVVVRRMRPDLAARLPSARWAAARLPSARSAAARLPIRRFDEIAPPAVHVPSIHVPGPRLPSVALPSVALPSVALPSMGRRPADAVAAWGALTARVALLAPALLAILAGPARQTDRAARRRLRTLGFWPYMKTPAE